MRRSWCWTYRGAASPNEVEESLLDRNAEEMAKESFYLVKSIPCHCYCQGWRFLTVDDRRLNSYVVEYLSQKQSR